jgi:hypothetical protein
MSRRRILLLLALAAVAAGLFLGWPRGPKEPVYQGKGLSHWINQKSGFVETMTNANVVNAIKSIGTNALPWLLSEFTLPESKWRSTFNRWISVLPGIGFRFGDKQDRVRTAALGLAFLGTNAAPALPILATYLGDADRSGWASVAMGGAGELALPYLLPALTSTSRTERLSAANGLGNAVYHSDAAIPAVVQLTQNSNAQVRLFALMALGNAKGRPDLLIPVYKEALSSRDPSTLRMAAVALAGKGEVTKAVTPELLRLMTNADPSVVRAASNTVFQMDPAALPRRGP